ncbi:MAG: tetratricopeptide repeat protein [Bacteroidota bacterium]
MAETQEGQGLNIEQTLGKTEDFVNKNKKSLMIIGGAIAVAVAGYLYYQYSYVAGKEKETQAQMFRAEEYFRNDSLKLAINGDGNFPGFEEITNDDGVSPSANLAHYYLGMTYLKNKEYDKAIEALKSYNAKDQVTSALTLGAIGDAYMELNNTEDAISYYEKAAKENVNNFTTPIFLMKLAAAFEMKGDYSEAADVYKRIKTDYSATSEGQGVEKYLARAEALAEKK